MSKYDILEERIHSLQREIEEVSVLIDNYESELDSFDINAAREAEKAIHSLQKLNMEISEELLELSNKQNIYETINRIKRKFNHCSIYFSKKNQVSKPKDLKYVPSDNTGKRPNKVTLFDQNYGVQYWKDVIIVTCEVMSFMHKGEFSKIFSIEGKKRVYFSTEMSSLKEPKLIPGTEIYCETNMSADMCLRLCDRILDAFGHKSSDLKVHTD